MAKKTKRAGRFSAVRRIIEEDYKEDHDYPMDGTVIPSAVSDDPEHSGVRFDVHAKKMNGTNLVIEKDGNLQTIHVTARAMEILRKNNKDGKRMNYAQAMEAAQKEEADGKTSDNGEAKTKDEKDAEQRAAAFPKADTGVDDLSSEIRRNPVKDNGVKNLPEAPEGPPVNAILPASHTKIGAALPSPGFEAHSAAGAKAMAPGLTPVATTNEEDEPEYMEAQRAQPKGKKRRKPKAAPAARPSAKVAVHFSSPLGSMGILAERAFVGGPNGICLVIIQYSPEGNFYIPPQSDEPVVISLEGKVYKCLTGIYYQIPGTPVMHTVYFIKE